MLFSIGNMIMTFFLHTFRMWLYYYLTSTGFFHKELTVILMALFFCLGSFGLFCFHELMCMWACASVSWSWRTTSGVLTSALLLAWSSPVRPDWPASPGTLLFLPLYMFFNMNSGGGTQVLMLAKQSFYWLNYQQSSEVFLYNFRF